MFVSFFKNWKMKIFIFSLYIYIYIYGIHHWSIFRSSYRKLAWVGFEPTTTEFRSDALTGWPTRPWVRLALRANFVQLLQFHLFVQCSRFISFSVHVSTPSIKRGHKVCFSFYVFWSTNLLCLFWLW